MSTRFFLGIAFAAAAAVAACGSPDTGALDHGGLGGEDPRAGSSTPGSSTTSGSATTSGGVVPGTLPTNSATGKAYFAANLQPFLDAKCSACHVAGGIGNPTWIVKGNAPSTYDMVYLNGFATASSRIVVKGTHAGGSAPELTAAEKTSFGAWIALETKDGGKMTQTNVLEKFGTCFDKTKFEAIKLGDLRTTRRQTGNNPTNQNENANNCTGCNNKPCSTCHSADDVTGFVMAIGNPVFPPDYTFEQSKKLDPAFIRQYVSTTPTGEPQFNAGIQSKSTNTIEKGLAYSHPMFTLTPAMETSIQAFVDDAVAKYKAGSCGK